MRPARPIAAASLALALLAGCVRVRRRQRARTDTTG